MLKKLVFASLVFFSACVSAQAQIKAEHPRNCVMSVGPDEMMFSAFQEDRTDAIFCRHIPDTGPTVLIVDAKQPELRDMNIEVRILRDLGQADWRENLDQTTVAALAPVKRFARSSTSSFRVDMAQQGKYLAIVHAFSDDGARDYVGEFAFTVGEPIPFTAALAVAIGALGVLTFGLWRRHSSARQTARAPQGAVAAE